jgi:S-formylglutathione hydrolase FrmB
MLLCIFVASSRGPVRAGEPQILQVQLRSDALSTFFGRTMTINATVLLPDSYYKQPNRRYPTIYVIPAFDGPYQIDENAELQWQKPMRALGSEFIIVFLQGMVEIDGEMLHQEYADSANDGPWGTALTTEFIPETEAHFRTVGTATTRFLFGHSSGAWSALWLQINYPTLFNGAWAVSPDPVDFHDFCGPDLTRTPAQNFYHDANGKAYPIDFGRGPDMTTSLQELVWKSLGKRQMDSFDEVFSPRNPDGKPARLFNRQTGAIDANVAQYWETHYDLTNILKDRWSTIGPELNGKLHVFVGTQDTFHLEGAVALMRDAVSALGGNAEFQFVADADHWQVFNWHGGLIHYSIGEMTARLASVVAQPSP